MISVFAALLLAATPAAAPDLSWLIDAEIPARVAAAQSEATRLDALAAQSAALRGGVLTRQKAALDEKAKLEASLPELSWGKKSAAEARIVELDSQAESAGTREKQLAAEAAAYGQQAAAQRAFAAAAAAEARSRQADAAKNALDPDIELGQLSDARLAEARAWHQRLISRAPKQQAALESELERASSIPDRGAVMVRKNAVRAAIAASHAEIQRIADEMNFRAESKHEEAVRADEMLAAGKARAAERETPVVTRTGPDKVDALLDRVIAAQDRQAAEAEARSKSLSTALRIGGAIAGLGALGATLYVVLRR